MKSFRQVSKEGENLLIEYLLAEKRKSKACPKGWTWNFTTLRCEPLTGKDRVNNQGGREMNPGNGPAFNTIGRTGVNGDGYAFAEPNDWGSESSGGCASCNEGSDPYVTAANSAQKKAKRHTLAMDRKDNHHKNAQKQQMSVESAQKALKREAERAKGVAPSEQLNLPVNPSRGLSGDSGRPSPVGKTGSGNVGRTSPVNKTGNGNRGRRSIKDNPLVLRTESKGCIRCRSSSGCRCLGNRKLIDLID